MSDEAISVVVGLGITGLSCVRYLRAQGQKCKVVDSRSNPPGLAELQAQFPEVEIELGGFDKQTLIQARELIMSPGVSLQTEAIAAAINAGVPVTGDIDIFSRKAQTPIVAVTGSNGKSTVVAVLAKILESAGKRVAVGGNLDAGLGRPALDLLSDEADFFVLELSSFQLETTEKLNAEVAVILNLSEDHMDRYADMNDYLKAKQRIFRGCRKIVCNRDEFVSRPPQFGELPVWDFGFSKPGVNGVGLLDSGSGQYLAYQFEPIIRVDELKIIGQHNIANVMAAIALALALDVELDAVADGIRKFSGLPHRCQWVREIRGIDFYNDSKGTNVGATVAAVEGLGQRTVGHVLLIAGGVSKGADFRPLIPVLNRWVREVILIGQDAMEIAALIDKDLPVHFAADLVEATALALAHADSGDAVLLSPACASFDMFDNFQHRGVAFTEAVNALQ